MPPSIPRLTRFPSFSRDPEGRPRSLGSLLPGILGGGFALFVVSCIAGVFMLIIFTYTSNSRYLSSGKAQQDALDYGCPGGKADRSTCAACPTGVCCDLRCSMGPLWTDVRLRCQPDSGCLLAPQTEVNVTNFGTSTTSTTN